MRYLWLKAVRPGGAWCALCPWSRLCRGCAVPCHAATALPTGASFYAVDWDPTALHLRYLAGAERAWQEDPSVAASRRAATGNHLHTVYICMVQLVNSDHVFSFGELVVPPFYYIPIPVVKGGGEA
jgi:hypothetical protein